MSLTLYFHPLSGFCQKVLVALYENETPFTPHLVNLGDPDERAALKLWPLGKFPLLRDDRLGKLVPETSLIIEHLALHYPGKLALLPQDPVAALEVRRLDRLFDLLMSPSPCRRWCSIGCVRRRAATRSASPRRRRCSPPPMNSCRKPRSAGGNRPR